MTGTTTPPETQWIEPLKRMLLYPDFTLEASRGDSERLALILPGSDFGMPLSRTGADLPIEVIDQNDLLETVRPDKGDASPTRLKVIFDARLPIVLSRS